MRDDSTCAMFAPAAASRLYAGRASACRQAPSQTLYTRFPQTTPNRCGIFVLISLRPALYDFKNLYFFFSQGGHSSAETPRKEKVIGTDNRYTRFALAQAKPPPLTSGDMLHWDGMGAVSRSLRLIPASELATYMDGRVLPAAAGHHASPVLSVPPLALIPSLPVPVIDWATEALRLTFYLDPVLLLPPRHTMLPRVTGTLIWVHGQEDDEGSLSTPRPALLVETPDVALQETRTELVFHLLPNDPLLHHMAIVLQNAVEAVGDIEQLYAEVLADALVAHCFSRHRAVQPARPEVSSGLTPYTLQHTLAYIEAHLDQKLSLATLAAVARMSLTHFAHLFKHSTGLAPHKYVSRSRMEHAKQLLTETDMPLIEIGQQVGCADQSHFTALFRVHTALTPKAYRKATRHM